MKGWEPLQCWCYVLHALQLAPLWSVFVAEYSLLTIIPKQQPLECVQAHAIVGDEGCQGGPAEQQERQAWGASAGAQLRSAGLQLRWPGHSDAEWPSQPTYDPQPYGAGPLQSSHCSHMSHCTSPCLPARHVKVDVSRQGSCSMQGAAAAREDGAGLRAACTLKHDRTVQSQHNRLYIVTERDSAKMTQRAGCCSFYQPS